ncbi:gamma-butyrobetaine hydroxylase-like domain-containing protein [Candidatus Neomarinimicrobiota bacterium]
MNPSESKLKLDNYEIVNNLLLLQWNDGDESAISLQTLRDKCPCAGCAGEQDIFGNVYKAPPQEKTQASYILMRFDPIGHYAFKPVWGDGHSSGLFTLEALKKMTV